MSLDSEVKSLWVELRNREYLEGVEDWNPRDKDLKNLLKKQMVIVMKFKFHIDTNKAT